MSNKLKRKQSKSKKKHYVYSDYVFATLKEPVTVPSVYEQNRIIPSNSLFFMPRQFNAEKTIKHELCELVKPLTEDVNLNKKSLLVIRYGGIGDIISTLYAIYKLKQEYPYCRICYCCNENYLAMLNKYSSLIDFQVRPIEDGNIIKQIDYFIDLTNVIEQDTENPIQIAFAKPFKRDFAVQIRKEYRTITSALQGKYKNNTKTRSGIGIQYSTNAPNRNYNIENIIKLINKLQELYPNELIYLLGKPDDYLYVNYIQAHSKDPSKIIPNGCGFQLVPIDAVFDFVATFKLVIAPDSSMLHIAGLTNTPMIGLFGAIKSSQRISFYNNAYAFDGDCDCSPCNGHFPFNFCPKTNGECAVVNSITPDQIIDLIQDAKLI